jgi:hypothetical protein
MKTLNAKQKNPRIDARTAKIIKALREARKLAIKTARMHGVPISYIKNGKLIRERV